VVVITERLGIATVGYMVVITERLGMESDG